MCKKYFDCFNKFIACTKKYYFFHYNAWIVMFAIFSLLAFITVFTLIFPNNPESDFFDYLSGFFLIILFMSFIGFIITIPITIISMIVKHFTSKSIFVSSDFLLNNKIYHFAYCTALFILAICWFIAIVSGFAIVIVQYGLSVLSLQ